MKLIECPRDAMQGLSTFIPTSVKAEYLNLLLHVGFDTLDFGSFVSPRAIPQMRDSSDVLDRLDLSATQTKLLAIVANLRGAEQAASYEKITYIGFPFSISETFQKRNTNSDITRSLETVEQLQNLCYNNKKEAVIYLSMAFGNPYGEEWSTAIAEQWTEQLVQRGCNIISLSDTIGVSTPEKINNLFPVLAARFPYVEFGLHLHSPPDKTDEKMDAAYVSGCRRFDSAIGGYGGCPMADEHLVGNIATEYVINYLEEKGVRLNLDREKWREAVEYSDKIFS
jgi:hydroxymethylglutaryl-CoA lyase